jgi:hypothetical protein
VKTAILIGNIEPAGKGPLGIDHDELSVISMDIIEGGCPPEGMGGSDLNPRLPHLFPKTPWSSKRSKVVIQNIDLHSFVAFLFKQFRQGDPGFVILEYIKLKTNQLRGTIDSIKDDPEGISPLP